MAATCVPGIAAVAYAFPAVSRSVQELARTGQLYSSPDTLESLGFGHVHVATSESPYELALSAARALLRENGIAPDSVTLLIYGGLAGSAAFAPADTAPTAPRRDGAVAAKHAH